LHGNGCRCGPVTIHCESVEPRTPKPVKLWKAIRCLGGLYRTERPPATDTACYFSQGDTESAAWIRVRVLRKATPSWRSRPVSRGSDSQCGHRIRDTVENTAGDTVRYTVENNTFGYKDKRLSEKERKEEKPTRAPYAIYIHCPEDASSSLN